MAMGVLRWDKIDLTEAFNNVSMLPGIYYTEQTVQVNRLIIVSNAIGCHAADVQTVETPG